MAEPFLGELRLMSFNFAPKGWAQCSGQFLPINQNQALFSLLGTTYGGNGQTTFALPDLRSRAPFHQGDGFTIGQRAGEESHTITSSEMAAHPHFVGASLSNGDKADIGILAGLSSAYGGAPNTNLNPAMITNAGGSQPHEN